MTSWRQVRPVPRGASTATHLPGCRVVFPRGSHGTSPLAHLQCPGGVGVGRGSGPCPDASSLLHLPGTAVGRTLRSHRRPRTACPWGPLSVAGERRSQPGRGAPAPRGAGKPPERSQARGGLLGQVTGLRAARGSPDPRAQHRHRGHLTREDRMARQPGQLGAPPEGAVGVRAHSRGRGACAPWWSRRGTEAAPATRLSGCGSEGARRARARGGEGERRCRGPPVGQPGQKARTGRGGRARPGLPVGAWQVALCAPLHRGGGARDKLASAGLACWRGLKGGGAGALRTGRWVARLGRPGGEAPEGQRKKKGFPDRESNPGRGGESAES